MHEIVEDSIDEEEDGPFVVAIAIAKLLAGSRWRCRSCRGLRLRSIRERHGYNRCWRPGRRRKSCS